MGEIKIKVLIPDGEEGNTRQILFLLSRSREYQIYILSNKKDDFIKYSRYCKKFYVSEETAYNNNRLKDIINIVEQDGIDIVFPTFVGCCQLVINNLDLLRSKTEVVLLPDIKNYNIASNKGLLAQFCLNNDISIPKTLPVNDLTILTELDRFTYPVLLKPIDGDGGKGIIQFEQVDGIRNFLNENITSVKKKFIIQEYISSQEIDANVLCMNGRILVYSIQRGIIPPDREFSFSKGVELVANKKVFELIKDIFRKLNWSGLAHVDLLYLEDSNEIFVLEINPRVWGTIIASYQGGINFAELIIKKSLDPDFKALPKTYKGVKYATLSIELLIKILKSNSPIKLSETNILQLLSDPLPTIMSKYNSWKKNTFTKRS